MNSVSERAVAIAARSAAWVTIGLGLTGSAAALVALAAEQWRALLLSISGGGAYWVAVAAAMFSAGLCLWSSLVHCHLPANAPATWRDAIAFSGVVAIALLFIANSAVATFVEGERAYEGVARWATHVHSAASLLVSICLPLESRRARQEQPPPMPARRRGFRGAANRFGS